MRAEFLPDDRHPAIRVRGILVFAYVDDVTGEFRVSVDLDEAEEHGWPDPVPVRITVQGHEVYAGG